jgi:hypothetical protein
MNILDIGMFIFLAVVIVGGLAGFVIYNKK